VCNIGHFDNEIQVAKLNESDVSGSRSNRRYDRYDIPGGKQIYMLAEGRLVNLGCATGHPSFVMSNSFTNQTLAQTRSLEEQRRLRGGRLPACPSSSTRRSPVCTSRKIGAKLTKLTPAQAEYLGVPMEGPYKPELYRY
jgi:adenosylhomocysteinase